MLQTPQEQHQRNIRVLANNPGSLARIWWKNGKDRDEDDQVDVWCSLGERQPSTELRRRLGVEAIGDVMRRDRLRTTCRKKGRCRLYEGMYYVGGGGEGACWQAREDLAEHCVSGHPRLNKMEGHRRTQQRLENHLKTEDDDRRKL